MKSILLTSLFFLISCSLKKKELQPIPITIEVERLEDQLFAADSQEEIAAIFKSHPRFSNQFLDANQYPSDTILSAKLFELLKFPSIDTLFRESKEAFSDFDELVGLLERGIGRLKSIYPETVVPKVHTAVTGFYKDLYVSDSLIIVGLDFFIGDSATYRPVEIPLYILRRYNRQHLVPILMKFLAKPYVYAGEEETLVSEMIDFGKTYYLLSKLLPDVEERILIGYTAEEWEAIHENEGIIWVNFVENELLYETEGLTKQKFLGERPNIYEIGKKCPGRIGAWVGWQIVKQFVDETGVDIKKLMRDTKHHRLFERSKYKPKLGR